MTDFDEYVRVRGAPLRRFAYHLCGDAHRAEDFVQEALIRCHRRWHRIERVDNPDGYVRKAILRQYLSWRRRPMAGELLTDRVADHLAYRERRAVGDAGGTGSALDRPDDITANARMPRPEDVDGADATWHLLARLPRQQRAVLALRVYEDLADAEIARLLGCSTTTVRVHAHRALTRLRRELEAAGDAPVTTAPAAKSSPRAAAPASATAASATSASATPASATASRRVP